MIDRRKVVQGIGIASNAAMPHVVRALELRKIRMSSALSPSTPTSSTALSPSRASTPGRRPAFLPFAIARLRRKDRGRPGRRRVCRRHARVPAAARRGATCPSSTFGMAPRNESTTITVMGRAWGSISGRASRSSANSTGQFTDLGSTRATSPLRVGAPSFQFPLFAKGELPPIE